MPEDTEKVELTAGAIRKMIEDAGRKGGRKAIEAFLEDAGFEDADEFKAAFKARKATPARKDGKDDRDDSGDAERKAAEAKAAAERAATEKALADKAKADLDAQIAALKKERDDAVAAARSEAKVQVDLIAAGVKPADLAYVQFRLKGHQDALPEADRAKPVDIPTFLLTLSKDAPQVFAEGRVPKAPEKTPEQIAAEAAAAAALKTKDTGSGPGPDVKKAGAAGDGPKDLGRASLSEINARLQAIGLKH